jgi:hypothetical protein
VTFVGSLADIPDELLSSDSRGAFVKWLLDLPVEKYVKRQFALDWQQATGLALGSIVWDLINHPSGNKNVS